MTGSNSMRLVTIEDIEKEQFGEDGFEDAVKQMSAIEGSLGLADIAQFTAPSPPKVST